MVLWLASWCVWMPWPCRVGDSRQDAPCRVQRGSVSVRGRVDIELAKHSKCVVYHVETDGCGFRQGGLGAPILQQLPRKTRAWSDMGICIVS